MTARNPAFRLLALVALMGVLTTLPGCGVGRKRVRLHPPEPADPVSAVDDSAAVVTALDDLAAGSRIIVVLADGGRFEADFRRTGETFPVVKDPKWKEDPPAGRVDLADDPWPYTYADIDELSVYRTTTTGWVLATVGAVAFLGIVVAMVSTKTDSTES